MVIPAALISAAFVVASLFTSRVANKSYDNAIARVNPDNCGLWSYDFSSTNALAAHNAKVLGDTVRARTYMTEFYSNTSSSPTVRSVFLRPKLPYNTSTSASCPIPDAERCIIGRDGAFSMTTDLLDSHSMLGINAKPADRITVQMSVTCSPISVRGLTETVETGNNSFVKFNLGALPGTSNSTYLYNLLTPETDARYLLVSRYALAGDLDSIWVPVRGLNRSDADVSVHFLSQNILAYMKPVFDPWFSANGTYTRNLGDGSTVFLPDYWANALVCADQFVVCNPTTGTCTAPAGLLGVESQAVTKNAPGFTATQLATAGRIIIALLNSNTFNSVTGLGAGALFANNLVFGVISTGLPNNQWQSEVLGWFQTSLAKLQAYLVEYASNGRNLGPYGIVTSPYNRKTNNSFDAATFSAMQDQCTNQLIQVSADVQNFSFLGVMIIVCVSVVLIVLSWSLESIVVFLERKKHTSSSTARQADSTLHLLRMALGNPEGDNNQWKLGKWATPVLADAGHHYGRPHGANGELVNYVDAADLAR